MRRVLGIPAILTAAMTAAVTLYVAFSVPPRAVYLNGTLPEIVRLGAYHVHTSRSDGTGSVDDVAAAAARAGLAFVIVTDHGDGTRKPDPPAYRRGVLVLDAVEINTFAGHVVALGLERASAYPLAGHPRDVVDDIHRLGGTAVIAHPDSPNPDLRWRGQNIATDGIEWLNVDSEWRDERPARLVASAARSLIRGPESIAALFSRPVASLSRLDAAARQRPTFTLAGLDAHANIGWRDTEEPRQRSILARPSYDAMFRTLAQAVMLERPLSGDAAADAGAVLGAITTGRSFSVVRAFGGPASLDFTAERGGHVARMGDRIPATGDAVSTTFRVSLPQAPGTTISLLENGRPVAEGKGSLEFQSAGEPGVYRAEAAFPGTSTPWLLSNPIVIFTPGAPAGPIAPADEEGETLAILSSAERWTVEKEPASSGTLTRDGSGLRFSFALAPGAPHGQYAAVATPIETTQGVARVRFDARASHPMRMSVQLRLPGGRDGRRWRRSVYLDETPRTIAVSLQEFDPVEPYTSQRPVVAPAQTLLLVVDTLNARPGTDGTIWISNVSLGVRQP